MCSPSEHGRGGLTTTACAASSTSASASAAASASNAERGVVVFEVAPYVKVPDIGSGIRLPPSLPLGLLFTGFFSFGGSPASALPLPSVAQRDPLRVLILMSATGGGHRASAQAIRAAFHERFGAHRFAVDIVDPITDHSRWPVSIMPPSYNFMVRHPWIWRINYKLSEPRLLHRPFLRAVTAYCASAVESMYEKYKPDLVVSVHPLLQHAPLRVLKKMVASGAMKPTPFATVVTDFATCHTTWFHRDVNKCFVPTRGIERIARRMGLSSSQIVMRGLPVRPDFAKLGARRRGTAEREAMRPALGIDKKLPCVLLVGGGEGMGPVEATATALSRRLDGAGQVVVICGRNESLASRLRKQDFGATRVEVRGFVHNMAEYMGASDCIITKAGPGTIAEALICGLPMILNDYIPCQEASNVPYVLDHGVGIFIKDPDDVAQTVSHWFSASGADELREMASKAAELGRPEATVRIVEDLAALIPEEKRAGLPI